MYYKLGQACATNWGSFVLLQIRTNVVTNWDSFIITNWGKCYYKLGRLVQIRAIVITKQGSYYKLGQNVLQIGTGITNQGNYYKLEHNICSRFCCYDLIMKIYDWLVNIICLFFSKFLMSFFIVQKFIEFLYWMFFLLVKFFFF